MNRVAFLVTASIALYASVGVSTAPAPQDIEFRHHRPDGRQLFERETFRGNGRTCRTCHSEETGTVSPQDARKRLRRDPDDPLFLHDGSDDGLGHGVTRMLRDATIRMNIPLAANVRLAADPAATSMVVVRGIPTTLNTPALDPVLMLDGREPSLESQATDAIHDHAQGLVSPTGAELRALVEFEHTREFFSSHAVKRFAEGGPAPDLPEGRTKSEKRGRRFFEDVVDLDDIRHGLCATCHSGPMLNQTNLTSQILFGIPVGTRFQDILTSTLNEGGNPVQEFVFNAGQPNERHVFSPDIGRAAITGVSDVEDTTFSNVNAFKIPQLRGIRDTAPYFHDNSAKTLEDVLEHYAKFFDIITAGAIQLSAQDKKDIVAFLKLLD